MYNTSTTLESEVSNKGEQELSTLRRGGVA